MCLASSMKRPAAVVKLEPGSFQKKTKPQEAPESEVAQPAEAPAQKPAEAPAQRQKLQNLQSLQRLQSLTSRPCHHQARLHGIILSINARHWQKRGSHICRRPGKRPKARDVWLSGILIKIFSCWILMLHTNKCTKKACRGTQKNPLWKVG